MLVVIPILFFDFIFFTPLALSAIGCIVYTYYSYPGKLIKLIKDENTYVREGIYIGKHTSYWGRGSTTYVTVLLNDKGKKEKEDLSHMHEVHKLEKGDKIIYIKQKGSGYLLRAIEDGTA